MERSVMLRGGPADGQNTVVSLVSTVLPSIIRVRVTLGVVEVRCTADYAEIVALDHDPSWNRYRREGNAISTADTEYRLDR